MNKSREDPNLSGVIHWGILLRLAKAAIQFLTVALIARMLDLGNLGAYFFIIALAQVLSIPAQFGFPQLVLRETVKYYDGGRLSAIKQLFRWASRSILWLSAAAMLAGFLIVWMGFGVEVSSNELAFGLCLIPLMALLNLRGSQVRAMGGRIVSQIIDQLLAPLAFLLFVAVVLRQAEADLNSTTILFFRQLGTALALVYGMIVARRILWRLARNEPPSADAPPEVSIQKGWKASAGIMGLSAGVWAINQNLDILLLADRAGGQQVALYRIAGLIAGGLAILIQSLNAALGPVMARYQKTGRTSELQDLINRQIRKLNLFVLPIPIVLVAGGDFLLQFIFGTALGEAYAPMLILLGAGWVNLFFGPAGVLLNMGGHEKLSLRACVIALLINVSLNLLLIPLLGAIGAAVATFVSVLLWNLILWSYARRFAKINTIAWVRFW